MRILDRELHLMTNRFGPEVYREAYTENNVERLWYDRLHTNTDVKEADLVYIDRKTGRVESREVLK